jgi:hypothetical protein
MRSGPSSRCHEPPRDDVSRRKLSTESRERLRAAALANQPWTKTRGPVSTQGKKKSAANGKFRQRGEKSRREIQAEIAGVLTLISQMAATRSSLL